MAKTTADRNRMLKKLGGVGAIATAASAVFIGVGSATANADVTEIGPNPGVSSRQADSTSRNGVRNDATWGEVRGTQIGDVHAHGEVKESMKAVPVGPRGSSRADGFRGGWYNGIRGGLR
ncbi:hypothetical protein [Mycolicibacterium hippocampi]|uniref:Uncharacterized protein n=1 Tax=Mycolicibacterium hippocampi TaxID=659824 RepID=A0A7I9ZLH2_9MYCO|nr:hypothetical protein [Mycolicibacterium hippocampi]GFH01891.1 hypothetical protein MHIP_23740 [Mycolicibacterium hippocampi]